MNNLPQSSESGAVAPSKNPKICPCGHDRTHFLVSKEGRYTMMGWFWVTVMGVTTSPIEVSFRCRKCGTVIEKSKKAEDLTSIV